MDEHAFRTVCSAVLSRKRLSFEYRARSTDEKTRRTVSPQRITHYRDNWYLDAWDEEKEALRSFSVDRISGARQLDAAARDVDDAQLDQHLAGSYGRSEEHTSELQSLMRISYAVFCLKKKTYYYPT